VKYQDISNLRLYSIDYDLHGGRLRYRRLIEALRRMGALHHLNSKWLLATEEPLVDVRYRLANYIDDQDSIDISEQRWTRRYRVLFDDRPIQHHLPLCRPRTKPDSGVRGSH